MAPKVQKSSVAPYLVHLDLRNAMVPSTTTSVSCDTDVNASGITWPKVTLHLIMIILTKQVQWCHWGQCFHNVIWIPISMASHGQKSHVTSPCDQLDPTNGMCHWWHYWYHVSLTLTSVAKNGQNVVVHCFNCYDLMNTMVLLIIHITYCWCQCQQCQMTEKSCCISFWSSWPNKCNGCMDDAISIMCCQHWYHMTQRSCCTLFQSTWPNTKCCCWQCYQCLVMLTLMPKASHDKTWAKMSCHTLPTEDYHSVGFIVEYWNRFSLFSKEKFLLAGDKPLPHQKMVSSDPRKMLY